MTSKWTESSLGEIIDLVIDYRGKTPKKLGSDWSTTGYRALSAKNIKTGQIVQPETIRFTDVDLYKRWMKDEIHRGDILLTSEAPFGEVFLWNSDEKIVLSQRLFALRCKEDFYSPYFYYYMTTEPFQGELRGRATGTTVTGLRQPELLKCTVKYPSINEQIMIAETLLALDSKINENRKINHHLEQMAQAIFKSWFVDFEPFADGEFVESELGEIPSDWRIASLKEVCSNITDGVHNTVVDDASGEYFLLSCKNIKDGAISTGATERRINKDTFQKLRKRTQLEKGDILLSSVGTIGEMALLLEEPTNIEFQRSVAMLKPNTNLISSYYLYESLCWQKAEIVHTAHGAVQQCLFLGDINSFTILLPDKNSVKEYTKLVDPLFRLIADNRRENASLANIRDALLPRLMSGELSVADIQAAK